MSQAAIAGLSAARSITEPKRPTTAAKIRIAKKRHMKSVTMRVDFARKPKAAALQASPRSSDGGGGSSDSDDDSGSDSDRVGGPQEVNYAADLAIAGEPPPARLPLLSF